MKQIIACILGISSITFSPAMAIDSKPIKTKEIAAYLTMSEGNKSHSKLDGAEWALKVVAVAATVAYLIFPFSSVGGQSASGAPAISDANFDY